MNIIQTASYQDRGFARIGPASHHLTAAVLKNCKGRLSDVYETEQSGTDVWMRSRERRTKHFVNFVDELSVVDANSNRDATWIRALDSHYDKFSNQIADMALPVKIMNSLHDKEPHKQVYLSSLALLHVHSTLREPFLRDFYFPWFFKLFPNGKILAFKLNSSYERRLTLLRWGNLLSIYDSVELSNIKSLPLERIQMMADLHPTGTINVKSYFLALSNIFYPYAHSIVVGGYGNIFVLLTGEDSLLDRGAYPQTRMELHKVHNLMSGNEPDISRLSDKWQGWLGRYIPTKHFSVDELVDLFRHFVAQFNHSLRLRIDVTNYRKGDDVDFIAAFEEYFTLDRLTLELNYCQTATEGFSARASSFGILDKLSELISISGVNRNRLFHHFAGKAFASTYLSPILQQYPAPYSTFFADECKRVYDNLHNTVLGTDGLWMSYRRTTTGIQTRRWDETSGMFSERSTLYTEDEFVGEVVRAIRNTHHGYISDNDERRRFAVFVSMHTGQLPDDFTAIPQLIWLAIIQNPESTILTECITDQKLGMVLY
jgi:hypothetical protein